VGNVTTTERPTVGVGAVVVRRRDGRDEVLLIQRGRPPNVGSWSLPGGRLEWGEALVDAARREVLEETSIAIEVGALVEVVELRGEAFHYVVMDYVARPLDETATPRAGDDAQDARYVAIDDIDRYGVTDAVARVVRAAQRVRT
jgi:ADP-ribose pyrophosphatase YjhB (NUDIX family)